MSTRTLFHDKIEETTGVGESDWAISERVLARWWCLVAFMKALDLLHQAMCAIVPPHCYGHQNGHQSGYISHRCFVCCCPGGRRGDTERVVARWWRPVTSSVALNMLHRASGDAACIASTPPHGNRNGQQQRHICSLPPPFSLGVIIAKDNEMVH